MRLRTLNEFIETELANDLRDPDFALDYIVTSAVEGAVAGHPEVVYEAVNDVARANGVSTNNVVKITSGNEYNAVVAEVERLFGSPVGSALSARFAQLATMVETYEQEHYALGTLSAAAVQQYKAEKRGDASVRA